VVDALTPTSKPVQEHGQGSDGGQKTEVNLSDVLF
jgi:hypothetical protein